ncbi:MAG: tRNA (adenosine(37)-N6)-threonylcarbamoyltransferase complex ATPase subunit type 1 TsaE [Chloroflexota bacterium]
MPESYEASSHSAHQTRLLGRALGALLRPGDTVLLEGEFGAGKTVFSQGVGEGLGVKDYVTSPSFTLVNEYRAAPPRDFPVYHVDLYRLEDPAEAFDLGLMDYLNGEGVVLIEWAERVRDRLADDYLLVRLRVMGVRRRGLRFSARGERYRGLLGEFAEALEAE